MSDQTNPYFPYELRKNQKEMMKFISDSIANEHKNICINAVTGFGKTPIILASLLDHGSPIIWVVRTGNETDRPIEELKIITKGIPGLFGLSIRGKRDMCLLAKEKTDMNQEDVSFLCQIYKDECKYAKNLEKIKQDEIDKFTEEPRLYSEILDFCTEKKICPYKFQFSLMKDATVVSMSYNYVINEEFSWVVRRNMPFGRSFLVVDEAHNLQTILSNLNSKIITLRGLQMAEKELDMIKEFVEPEEIETIRESLDNMKDYLKKFLEKMKKRKDRESIFDMRAFCNQAKADLSVFKKLGNEVRKMRLAKGQAPRSSLFHLSNFLQITKNNIDVLGVVFIATDLSDEVDNIMIEQWDMRSSDILRNIWDQFSGSIFCSGTLLPIDAFAETIGIEDYAASMISSTYTNKNVLALVTKDLSTAGEKLDRKMKDAYINSIEKFLKAMQQRNIAIFFSSYRIQNEMIKEIGELAKSYGKKLFIESRGMSGDLCRQMLDEFKKKGGLLCGIMAGRFAEGADFPDKELEGIFLVGIPFDQVNLKTKLYLNYYTKLYGEKGRYYAYTVPALRRASQALGRALRSEEDRAVLVLGDERYANRQYFALLPDYIRNNTKLIDGKSLETMTRMFWL